MDNFEFENWLPMGPLLGPPLPRFLNIFWPWYKPPLPEPPEEGVVVGLLNPPSGANKWQIRIVDDVGLKTLAWGVDAYDNIKDAAIFELSPEWLFPLMVDISIYEQWQENGEWHSRQLYRAQSIWPYIPNYLEVFIPEYGSYYYNVAAERFEKV